MYQIYQRDQRLYKALSTGKLKYLGKRNIYVNNKGLAFIKKGKTFIPTDRLKDNKGYLWVI